MPKILLVDGSNYLFRAFHALPPLTTSRGEPTGALKGFRGMLKSVVEAIEPDFVACVFDAHAKTFRHAIYPLYKANRPPMPEELRLQLEPIQTLVRLLGWPLIEVEGVEADDVLATLALRAASEGIDAYIATGDKDLAQVVGEHVRLVNTMTHTVLDREGVYEKYGVYPERIIDYLTLMGDKVDNVPGIQKCGPKTAAKWLEQFGSLEGVVAAAETVPGKAGEYLREGIGELELSRRLVTIDTEVKDLPAPQSLVLTTPDETALAAFYERWEMRSALGGERKRPDGRPPETANPKEPPAQADLFASIAPVQESVGNDAVFDGTHSASYELVDDAQKLACLASRLEAVSSEGATVSLALLGNPAENMLYRPVALALSVTPCENYFLPLAMRLVRSISYATLRAVLGRWFASEATKAFHDVKAARHALANIDIELAGQTEDTLLMSYVLEAHLKHDLPGLAVRYLASPCESEETVFGKGASRRDVANEPLDTVAPWLVRSASAIKTLCGVLTQKIDADARLRRIYREIELPVASILWKMERTGVAIDALELSRQSEALCSSIATIEGKISEMAGEAFNPASPKQLAHILFEKLGLPVQKKTSSGTPSTDEEVLAQLALDYPLPKFILEYRKLTKLKGTYTDKLPGMVDLRDGRIHTTFGQATAVTGRLASSEPNLQNIPVRTPEGRRVREAFVAAPGSQIVSADYSQIELRVMAHISGDEGLLRAFREGEDIHRATASEVFGVELSAVTSEQRRMAKVINFGLIYGMSAFGLAKNLGIERSAAAHYMDQYFARYPKVAQYMKSTRELAKAQGFVETAFGRRLWLPELLSPRAQVRAAAERAAINAPMQGTAADLIKLAMLAVDGWITENALQSRLVLQVHDELVLEVPIDELERVKEALPRLMAGVAHLAVPLVAEVGVAENWEAAH